MIKYASKKIFKAQRFHYYTGYITNVFCSKKQPPPEENGSRQQDRRYHEKMIELEEKKITLSQSRAKIEQNILKGQEDHKRLHERMIEVEKNILSLHQRVKVGEQNFKEQKSYIAQIIRLEKQKTLKQNNNSRHISITSLLVSIITLILGAYYSWLNESRQNQQTQQYRRKKLLEKYQKLLKEDSYISGKSVENKMRPIFQTQKNQIQLILGVEGIGKTSAAKQILSQKQKRGENVYYLNLRESQKTEYGIFKQMEELIMALSSEHRSVKTILVIDEINQFENLREKVDRIQKQNLIIDLSKKGVKVILISSSTSFYYDIWKDEMIKKFEDVKQHMIWMMEEQQYRLILQKKGDELKIQRNFVEQIIDFGLPLRKSVSLLKKIAKARKQYRNNTLKTEIELKKNQFLSKAQIILETNKFDSKATSQLYKGFTENTPHQNVSDASFNNCAKLQSKIKEILGPKSSETVEKVFKQFDQKNLMIFCYPRSKMIKNLLKERLSQLEKNQSSKY